MHFYEFSSPVGRLGFLGNAQEICQIFLPNQEKPNLPSVANSLFLEGDTQINLYLQGKLQSFSLPYVHNGTVFQEKLWKYLETDIPYGDTVSYGEIAVALGNPQVSRAVGRACGQNPLPLLIPCHRVCGKNGGIGGYAGGIPLKKYLLDLEQQGKNIGKTPNIINTLGNNSNI